MNGDEHLGLHSTAEAVARRSYGKLVAYLSASTRDLAAAEDALSEAFASALSDWPRNGTPDNPEAWLLTVARRKIIDSFRLQQRHDLATGEIKYVTETEAPTIPDRRLALLFACAHPAIDEAVRSPLMLQVVLGLDAKAIASAFLMSPAAMGKRLVRAKEKIRESGIPFRVPEREELPARLDDVLNAIYGAFAEGWSDPAGTDTVGRELTAEALFLARLLVELLPEQPEAMGLLALMLHAEARRKARRNRGGDFVPLAEQDQKQWDWPMIAEAEALIRHASELGKVGRYQLEAALQSAHVYRRRTGEANWREVVELYDLLLIITGSAVVAINRAVAIAGIDGPEAGLKAMPEIDARLNQYQPYWAARAELLARCGNVDEARKAYDLAIGLERDPAVRSFLQNRQDTLKDD